MSDTRDRVKKTIANQLGLSIDKIPDHASFIDDLGADSLDTVELVMALEEEFNLSIPDDKAEKITTVIEAISYIEEEIVKQNTDE